MSIQGISFYIPFHIGIRKCFYQHQQNYFYIYFSAIIRTDRRTQLYSEYILLKTGEQNEKRDDTVKQVTAYNNTEISNYIETIIQNIILNKCLLSTHT